MPVTHGKMGTDVSAHTLLEVGLAKGSHLFSVRSPRQIEEDALYPLSLPFDFNLACSGALIVERVDLHCTLKWERLTCS